MLFGMSRDLGCWLAHVQQQKREEAKAESANSPPADPIRKALELEKKHSLRICRWLPWIRLTVGDIPLPESEVLPCNDTVCNGILGTTLLYYVYAHLR